MAKLEYQKQMITNRGNEKNHLEFHCSLLKLNSEKVKVRLDEMIETVQRKVIPLYIMPESLFWQKLPYAKMHLQEAQNMIHALTEILSKFAHQPTLELSPVLAACDPTKLYQPCDFLPSTEIENDDLNETGTLSSAWLEELCVSMDRINVVHCRTKEMVDNLTNGNQGLISYPQEATHDHTRSIELVTTLQANGIQGITADAQEENHDYTKGSVECVSTLQTNYIQGLTADAQVGHDYTKGIEKLISTLKTNDIQALTGGAQEESHDHTKGSRELISNLKTNDIQGVTADAQEEIHDHAHDRVKDQGVILGEFQCGSGMFATLSSFPDSDMYILDDQAEVDLGYETNPELKDPPLGSVVNVCLSNWEHPNLVWIQLDGREAKEMNEKLRHLCSVPLSEVHVGMRVVAVSGLDGLYYRSVVTNCTEDSQDVEVAFVDYGNKETVKKDRLFQVPPSCSGIPYMAYACIVTQVNGRNWIDATKGRDSDLFHKLMTYVKSDKPLHGILKKVLPGYDGARDENVDIPRYFISFVTPEVAFIPIEDDLEYNKIATCDELSGAAASGSDAKESTSGSEADEKNECPLLSWEPLAEEDMRNLESSKGHWTSLLAPVTEFTDVYTIDADRKVARTKKEIQIGFKTHVWDEDDHLPVAIGNIEESTVDLEEVSSFVPPKPQIELGFELQPVSLSHVVNPQKFYLRLDDINIDFERFQHSMQKYYKNEDNNPVKEEVFPIGSYWAVHSKDGKWYRAVVISDSETSDLEITKTHKKLKVHYIDNGSEEDVDANQVRALTEEFCGMHSLAIPCCLYRVYPNHAWESDPWPQESTETFVRECFGLGASMFAQFRFLDTIDTYKVILFNRDKVNINEFMVFSGHAVSAVMSKSDSGDTNKQTVDESTVAAIPTGWNPMAADYLVPEKAKVDDESAEIILTGLKNSDETRICKFYRNGKICPRSVTCPFEHSRPIDGITTEKTRVFHLISDSIDLPGVGDVVAALVTAFVSPLLFYMYLPYGNRDLRESQSECEAAGNESLEKLCSAMYDYYHLTLPEPDLVLPAPGEIKVVCELDSGDMVFSRARVLHTQKADDTMLIQVFFIDRGDKAWVKEEQLRQLAPQFAHLPAQAIECYLANVERPEGGWSTSSIERLDELIKGVTLVAEITSTDIALNRLGVVLYNTDGELDMNINETLKSIMNE